MVKKKGGAGARTVNTHNSVMYDPGATDLAICIAQRSRKSNPDSSTRSHVMYQPTPCSRYGDAQQYATRRTRFYQSLSAETAVGAIIPYELVGGRHTNYTFTTTASTQRSSNTTSINSANEFYQAWSLLPAATSCAPCAPVACQLAKGGPQQQPATNTSKVPIAVRVFKAGYARAQSSEYRPMSATPNLAYAQGINPTPRVWVTVTVRARTHAQ